MLELIIYAYALRFAMRAIDGVAKHLAENWDKGKPK